MNNKSLEALHQNMIELSKSQPIHYEVAAKEISENRLAILKVKNAELVEALARIADGFDGYNSEDWQIIVEENRQVAKDALSSHHAKGPINL